MKSRSVVRARSHTRQVGDGGLLELVVFEVGQRAAPVLLRDGQVGVGPLEDAEAGDVAVLKPRDVQLDGALRQGALDALRQRVARHVELFGLRGTQPQVAPNSSVVAGTLMAARRAATGRG